MAFSITFITLIFYRISRTFSKTNRTDSSLHFNFFAIQKCYRMPIIAGIFRPIYFNFKIILTSGNVICLYFCIIRSQISPCTTFSIYYDWNFRKLLSLLRIQIPCFMRISCKKTVPLKFLIFSSTLGTIATASFVPRAPSIKSFCIYLDY